MKTIDKVNAIHHIRPNAEFVLIGNKINWVDTEQTQPTDAEIAQAWIDYQAKLQADKAEAIIKRQNALAKLAALGLEEDDLKALGL